MALIDHIQVALDRIITQYRESQILKDVIQIYGAEANELEQAFCDLINSHNIDDAEGDQLDIIGIIVGQPRTLLDANVLFFFGFDGAAGAEAFGTLTDPTVGARWRSLSEDPTGNLVLSDTEYRLFIRARIKKNNTRATPEDIISIIRFIFEAPLVNIVEGNDAEYCVQIGKLLTLNEQALIANTDLVPKPSGVSVCYSYFDPTSFLAFSDVNGVVIPGSQGFGTVANPGIGGNFGSIINL
ncbi:DUF2612 domain-containing protein [Patescibacteria group bacterium]|nr:DUF2612 domain-containing protein [Patescibacteria group bacterium]